MIFIPLNSFHVEFYMNDILVENTVSTISEENTTIQTTLKLMQGETIYLQAITTTNKNKISSNVPRGTDSLFETIKGRYDVIIIYN